MSENALYKTALARAMALCANREFCISGMQNKLQFWGVNEKDREKIIFLLRNEMFINEERFSLAFVKDKFNINKWGKIKIASYLKAMNIPAEIIKKALDSIDNEIYKKTLFTLISDHRRSVKAKNQYDLKAKLLRYGLAKGFESSVLYDILNDPEE
jgi:regulatory protein